MAVGKWTKLALLFVIVLSACTSTPENNSKITNNQTQEQGAVSANASNNGDYAEIITKARRIEDNFADLIPLCQKFLASQNDSNCAECASVAMIGAAANYLNDDTVTAAALGKKAYDYNSNHTMPYLAEWNALTWANDNPPEQLAKLAKMKDFLVSCSNGGADAFKQANIEFTGHAEYQAAVEKYQQALQEGLQDSELRRNAYVRLALSLLNVNKDQQAKQVFLQAWLVFPKIEINVGDQKSRDILNSWKSDFSNNNF